MIRCLVSIPNLLQPLKHSFKEEMLIGDKVRIEPIKKFFRYREHSRISWKHIIDDPNISKSVLNMPSG